MRVRGIVAIITCILFCGCSDDGNGNGPGNKIKIGLLAPFSGSLEAYGKGMKNGAIMAVEHINAAGGVLGQDLELLLADSETDEKVAPTAAQKLVTDGAIAIAGPCTSGCTIAAFDAVKGDRVPVVASCATSPKITTYETDNLLWRTVPSDTYQGELAADYVFNKLGFAAGKTAGLIYIDNPYGKGLATAFKDQFIANGGTVLNDVVYPNKSGKEIDQYSYEQEAKDVLKKNGEPDLIYIVGYHKDMAKITVQMKKEGYSKKPLFFGADGIYSEDFINNADATIVEGMYGTGPVPPTTDPNYKAYSKSYKTKYSIDPQLFSEATYDAVLLIALAMERAKKAAVDVFPQNLAPVSAPPGDAVTPADLKGAFAKLKGGSDVDYTGASGPINWDENGDVTSGHYEVIQIVKQGTKLDFETKDIISFGK
jgi:ABC-type branched-subunit amino acid transport system substrate-binding protein